MGIDTSQERHEHEAIGWERGLYADIKDTFRAPVVNWIWRTLVANEPRATRYLWGQVKPLFQTRACRDYVRAHRQAVRSRVDPPRCARSELAVSPGEYRELQGQVRTFDAVVPRLSLLFEVADRALHGEAIGGAAEPAPAALEPHGIDVTGADRRAPTMVTAAAAEDALPETVEEIRAFHGLDEGLPSIYRCLTQWPTATRAVWEHAAPSLRSGDFQRATERCGELAAAAAAEAAYRPRLAPADFAELGLSQESVAGLQDLFAEFNAGAIETVLPAVHVYAAALGIDETPEP